MVYGNFESALYAVLGILVSTTVLDRMLYGSSGGKLAFVISENAAEIKECIYKRLKRGVSEMQIRGGYSGQSKTLLLCALRRQQTGEFLSAIKEADNSAFVVFTEAGEIFGRGF